MIISTYSTIYKSGLVLIFSSPLNQVHIPWSLTTDKKLVNRLYTAAEEHFQNQQLLLEMSVRHKINKETSIIII